jgi:hypothetical protein
MNRREAIAALTALPTIASIARADVKPTDVIVVECNEIVSDSEMARIRETLQPAWPRNRILVTDRNVRLKIVSQP